MAVKIKFDVTHNTEQPTFVLATRNGNLLGKIPAVNVRFKDCLNSYSDLSFEVNKVDCANDKDKLITVGDTFWEQIKDFKLVWVRDWNKLFELKVDLNEEKSVRKIISAKSLGEAELSQINLYNIEINTETDIERKDYKPTVIFDETDKNASLLSRITEKSPHYHFRHIDSSIAKLQRTFTFDNISIYDALQEIAEEINCLFQIECYLDGDGNIVREINVYDLESYCYDCGHRGEFINECDECHSTNIKIGYGEDTTIFITTENLADNVSYTTDADSVKNCFKLKAGDDLMTATVANCNPNGSPYIWYISDELKEDMSIELVNKLAQYDDKYAYYKDEYTLDFTKYKDGTQIVSSYNALIEKYKVFTEDYPKIDKPIVGYANLMQKYYDTIDFYLYLNNTLMPSVEISKTTAAIECTKINTSNLSPVAVQNIKSCSLSTANSAVLAMAKTVINSTRYQVKVKDSTYEDGKWLGTFIVTNYSDEEDTAETNSVFVNITGDYEEFVKQKIEKILHKQSDEATDIVDLFKLSEVRFTQELRKYCLTRLNNFYDCCQSCLDILVEQGIANSETWSDKTPNLYEELYIPYYNKLFYIQNEITVREKEIQVIAGVYDKDGDLSTHGIQTILEHERNFIQDELNFEKFLGTDLWLEFVSYRREDTYENSNYISDGFNNAQLFENALKFIEVAKKDIFKSATLQHSISSELKNLLVIKDFEPLLDYFEIGNWLKIRVDDKIYQLRLVDYQIDFNNIDRLSVTFSDVRKFGFNKSLTAREKIQKAASMATSYGSVTRQAEKGKKSNDKLNDWVNNGLALTKVKIIDSADNQNITWDSHGLLCKEYLPFTDTYSDKQLKIINRGLYLTDDNWQTARTGIGDFTFYNPDSKQYEEAYGVIADVLVGNLILSKKVGIYNTDNSITLDDHGLIITTNAEGKPKAMMTLQRLLDDGNGNEYYDKIMYIADDGNLVLNGSVHINSATSSDTFTIDEWRTSFDLDMEGIHEEVSKVETNVDGTLKEFKTSVDTTINDISSTVSKKVGKDEIISQINQSAEAVKIKAGKISLEGTVTMNGNVKITEDGRMIAKNGEFSGTVKTKGADNSGNSLVTAVLHGSDYASTDQFTAGITFYNIYGKRIGFYRGYADGNDDNMRALNSYVFKSDGISVSSGISLQGGGLAYLIDSHGTGNILSTSNTLIESGTAFIEERYMEEIDETYTAYIDGDAKNVVRKGYSCTMPITGNKAFTKNAVAVVTANTSAPHLVWATCSKVDSNGNFTIYLHRRDGRYSTSISWMLIESKV